MKKKNSVSEFTGERSLALLKNFRESLARQSQISLQRAFADAAEAPAPRFWVSEARATVIIRKMIAGEDMTSGMYPEKARMYLEIYDRVMRLHLEEPSTPLGDLVFRVVNEPAPSSYISPERARKLIYKSKKT